MPASSAISRTSSVSLVLAGATTSPVSAIDEVVDDDRADQVRTIHADPGRLVRGRLLQALAQRAVEHQSGEQGRRCRLSESLRPLALGLDVEDPRVEQ